MKITYNNVDLELDTLEVSNMELIEKAYDDIEKSIGEIKSNTKGKRESGLFREFCNTIYTFIDTLFGDNKHLELFKDGMNVKEIQGVYHDIVNEIDKEKLMFNEYNEKIKLEYESKIPRSK